MLPESLKAAIQQQLGETLRGALPVSGGSINQAAKITLSKTGSCFLKWHTTADPDMFQKEVLGLRQLASAETDLIIPRTILHGVTEDKVGFLLLDYLEEGRPASGSASRFGQSLAALHKVHADQFGLDHDNYIGRLPQSNTRHDNWTTFFIEERIEPQLAMALDADKLTPKTSSAFHRMYKRLPEIFPQTSPSLLHGDLWGGNYFYHSSGEAAIYDPAVYYGHPEIELAFTHLFGGFSGEFYQAYEESQPLEPGFPQRKDIYNLYPLLVHTNLFGGSYARQVESIVSIFG